MKYIMAPLSAFALAICAMFIYWDIIHHDYEPITWWFPGVGLWGWNLYQGARWYR